MTGHPEKTSHSGEGPRSAGKGEVELLGGASPEWWCGPGLLEEPDCREEEGSLSKRHPGQAMFCSGNREELRGQEWVQLGLQSQLLR